MTISASVAETPQEAGTSRTTKWVIALFFVALFIPGSANLGIRMNPYRLYLMIMAIPMVVRASRDPTLRIAAPDALIFLLLSWQSFSILVNHRTSELVYAGASFGENLLGYTLGRVFIRNSSDFRFFFKCFLAMLLALLPFALVESLAHRRLLNELAGHVLQQSPDPSAARIRFGLLRVRGPFDTFLVFGAFCAIGFANVFYIYLAKFPKNILYPGFVVFMTALAISTSSLLAIFVQMMLIIYNGIFRWLRYKWLVLVLFSIIPVLFAKSIIGYIMSDIMFSNYSGLSRATHFEFGLNEIYRHPIFGIGLNRWANAYWLSQAVDNYWLSLTLRTGIPSAVLAASFFAVHSIKIWSAVIIDKEKWRLRIGYLISFASIMLGFLMFNFFSAALVFFMAYCGAGAMFYNGDAPTLGISRRTIGSGGPRTVRTRPTRQGVHYRRLR